MVDRTAPDGGVRPTCGMRETSMSVARSRGEERSAGRHSAGPDGCGADQPGGRMAGGLRGRGGANCRIDCRAVARVAAHRRASPCNAVLRATHGVPRRHHARRAVTSPPCRLRGDDLIYRLQPEARSRLTTVYMTSYFIGGALGSATSAALFDRAGWSGVCVLGATYALIALVFWLTEFVRRSGGS